MAGFRFFADSSVVSEEYPCFLYDASHVVRMYMSSAVSNLFTVQTGSGELWPAAKDKQQSSFDLVEKCLGRALRISVCQYLIIKTLNVEEMLVDIICYHHLQ